MRVLLLARHYPPAISGGAKRPFLLAGALHDADVDIRVCAPSLPPGEAGWTVPHPNRDPPTAVSPPRFNMRALAREWLLWPDPDIRWCRRACKAVLGEEWRPDWVISTSPPESAHVAGELIARRTGARWAADFRDLWLEAPHRQERKQLHRRIGERMLAHRLLPKADIVTAVDSVVAAEATALGARNVHVLSHFVADIRPAPAGLSKETLNIVHAGSVALSDPEARLADMLRPFEAARARNPSLRLHLVGRMNEAEEAAVRASPAADAIRLRGVMPLEGALAMMAAADALIFVASSKMHVPPSKIVDYLTFDVPIVACGEGPWRSDPRTPAGDPLETMASLRRGDGRNVVFRPRNATESAAQLLDLMRESSKARD